MEILRYAAFTRDPAGGNPAGVVLDATGASDDEMLGVAADLGYSESAFLLPRGGKDADVRYFSPLAEVPFCGHATIATAVAYAERHGAGRLNLATAAGLVQVTSTVEADGQTTATLVSVPPRVAELNDGDLTTILECLGWHRHELDPALPPMLAFAGAWHPIIGAGSRARLADLDYDFDQLRALMAQREWTTVDLLWREREDEYHARNPFPPGGVVEDPATGAAAAAFGAYLRALGLVSPPATVTVHQGVDIGRPSTITVDIPAGADTGIAVTGAAVSLG